MGTAGKTERYETGWPENSPADRIMITYYTDPLCCWSWALEPHWQRMREEYGSTIQWNYVMGGMIQDWSSYNDPLNAITKPIQLGPVWMHASQISDIPIDSSIWHTDPPASSYPSCIAVKCAQLQTPEAGELMLYSLRKAVMTQARNVAKESVIFSIAETLSNEYPGAFSLEKFLTSWQDGSGANAFRGDLGQTRFLKIGRYPTLTFTLHGPKGIIITGYRPFDVLRDALEQMIASKNDEKKTRLGAG